MASTAAAGGRWWRGLLAGLACALSPAAQPAPTLDALPASVGLDHVPVVVSDLADATETYRKLGFSIKPGRRHANGIENNHVKFADGSGIELITAPAAVDPLTARYRGLLGTAEGPAFLGLHARDTAQLIESLRASGFRYRRGGGVVELESPGLGFLFFVRDNRSPTDRPEHLTHRNGARAMVRVWVAAGEGAALRRLLTDLGGTTRVRIVHAPVPVQAPVVSLENGEVVILPASHQLAPGRPVVGATFAVEDLAALAHRLAHAGIRFAGSAGGRALVVSPAQAHGLWLEFRE